MVFSDKLLDHFSGNKTLAPGLTLLTMLIAITPLCGYLFTCGCTWPGLGLDSACNIHNPHALRQCPWCVSALAGWLSLGFAVLAGVFASMASIFSFYRSQPLALISRILSGISAFAVVALLTAMISAYVQDYPMQ